jgi:hypothetical protein
MPENAIIYQRERFERIATDVAYLSQFLLEMREITDAAREVLRQRYSTDGANTFGRDFPQVSEAIYRLGNLVGIPPKDRGALECQRKREASRHQETSR